MYNIAQYSINQFPDVIEHSPYPTPSLGGFSDIYIGNFKAGAIHDPRLSSRCLVCQVILGRLENNFDVIREVCRRCEKFWEGKLAVKKLRVHIQNRDHFKVRGSVKSDHLPVY